MKERRLLNSASSEIYFANVDLVFLEFLCLGSSFLDFGLNGTPEFFIPSPTKLIFASNSLELFGKFEAGVTSGCWDSFSSVVDFASEDSLLSEFKHF